MSVPVTETGATPETATSIPSETPDEQLGGGDKKALEAERAANKDARKRIADLEAQVKAFETEKMSDLEKAQAAATEAMKRAEAAESRAMRAEIATKFGISKDDAELFLTASDEASLTRQAEALAAKASSAPRTPKPDLTQGRASDVKASTEAQFSEFFKSQFNR